MSRQPGGPIHEFPLPASLCPPPASAARPRSATRSSTSTSIAISRAPVLRGQGRLDVACSEGYGAALLEAVARTVVGVDSSPEAIAHAETHYGSEHVTFARADATAVPLASSSVDTVVCFETLEHLSDHDALLDALARVLRPDGVLLLSTPTATPISPARRRTPTTCARSTARARRPASAPFREHPARGPVRRIQLGDRPARRNAGGTDLFRPARREPLRIVGRAGRPGLPDRARLERGAAGARAERAARPAASAGPSRLLSATS